MSSSKSQGRTDGHLSSEPLPPPLPSANIVEWCSSSMHPISQALPHEIRSGPMDSDPRLWAAAGKADRAIVWAGTEASRAAIPCQ